VWGEIGLTSRLLLENLPERIAAENQREKIAQLWQEWRDEKRRRAAAYRGAGLNSAIIFQHLSDGVPGDAVIAVDVGNNTYSFGRYFECKQQSVIMSGYLGSIGFAFPAAMGAWAACPDRAVVSISGDGGFGQYLAEFTTAVKYTMNITHVLLNNNELGKISKEQRESKKEVWETSLRNPDFSRYAENAGGRGIRVTEPGTLPAALREALAYPGPALVEIVTDAELI
jgi:thiamine pyrophosphate-dependent acetolactate synthase large subunit-like protein